MTANTIEAVKNRIEDTIYDIPHGTTLAWDWDEKDNLIDRYAREYMDGVDFATTVCARMLGGFGQRPDDADEAEQFGIIAQLIFDKLNASAVKRWIEAMPREQAVVICDVLGCDNVIEHSTIRMTGDSLRSRWNELHPSEAIQIDTDQLPSV